MADKASTSAVHISAGDPRVRLQGNLGGNATGCRGVLVAFHHGH